METAEGKASVRTFCGEHPKNRHLSMGSPFVFCPHRIYIRFHAKKMLDLTETGLQNCLLLFLVLALSADLEESVGGFSFPPSPPFLFIAVFSFCLE